MGVGFVLEFSCLGTGMFGDCVSGASLVLQKLG